MDLLKIFQTLQFVHGRLHVVFYFKNDIYLVHDVGDDSDTEEITDLNTAFVSGTSASGEAVSINSNELLECQFHMMTIIHNQDESIETNFIKINLDQTLMADVEGPGQQTFLSYKIYDPAGKRIDAGVANDMSEEVTINLPAHNLFLECELYHVERICEEEGFAIFISEHII